MDLKIPDSYISLFKNNKEIVKYPNEILRQSAVDVLLNEDISKTIKKMSDVLRKTNGVGIAAPQIGVSKRIIIVKQGQSRVLINPEIQEYSGNYISEEGCLSVPGLWGKVERYQKITVSGILPNGKNVVLNLADMEAVVLQHEIDHLNGIMFFDKAIPDSLHWFSVNSTIPLLAEFNN